MISTKITGDHYTLVICHWKKQQLRVIFTKWITIISHYTVKGLHWLLHYFLHQTRIPNDRENILINCRISRRLPLFRRDMNVQGGKKGIKNASHKNYISDITNGKQENSLSLFSKMQIKYKLVYENSITSIHYHPGTAKGEYNNKMET